MATKLISVSGMSTGSFLNHTKAGILLIAVWVLQLRECMMEADGTGIVIFLVAR
ncbi:hypothetical protein NMYAN_210053 [Nitrosomonas nitrosa]|uniref:Uncharacterized protein n=1 Tax=Nitrosomonas nitrosa TaxID=52442 RepID=A0A8H8Z267_9PROT|nr:hypothetical protein NMYAN_210053 [Nitrosomonas nitrosa]